LEEGKGALPDSRIASYASTHDRTFVSENGRTTFALVYLPAKGGIDPGQTEARQARAALNGVTVAGSPVNVPGLDALRASAADGGKDGGASMALEALTAGGGALLVLLPVPFLRSIGIAGMLIPLVSVAVAITLLPVVLATIGPRLDRRHARREDHASRGWDSSSPPPRSSSATRGPARWPGRGRLAWDSRSTAFARRRTARAPTW
jgi:hypothetical protein